LGIIPLGSVTILANLQSEPNLIAGFAGLELDRRSLVPRPFVPPYIKKGGRSIHLPGARLTERRSHHLTPFGIPEKRTEIRRPPYPPKHFERALLPRWIPALESRPCKTIKSAPTPKNRKQHHRGYTHTNFVRKSFGYSLLLGTLIRSSSTVRAPFFFSTMTNQLI
jgi:hypothetical protein